MVWPKTAGGPSITTPHSTSKIYGHALHTTKTEKKEEIQVVEEFIATTVYEFRIIFKKLTELRNGRSRNCVWEMNWSDGQSATNGNSQAVVVTKNYATVSFPPLICIGRRTNCQLYLVATGASGK